MSQLFNPIQNKLTKMRASQMLRHAHTETTPLKTEDWTEHDKENLAVYTLTQYTKQEGRGSEAMERRLAEVERKLHQKEQANTFYKSQLNRRREKYEKEIRTMEEEFEREAGKLEQELIWKMKREQELDRQADILNTIIRSIDSGNIDEINLQQLDDEVLQFLQRKLTEEGVVVSDLLYSKETLPDRPTTQKCNRNYYQYECEREWRG